MKVCALGSRVEAHLASVRFVVGTSFFLTPRKKNIKKIFLSSLLFSRGEHTTLTQCAHTVLLLFFF